MTQKPPKDCDGCEATDNTNEAIKTLQDTIGAIEKTVTSFINQRKGDFFWIKLIALGLIGVCGWVAVNIGDLNKTIKTSAVAVAVQGNKLENHLSNDYVNMKDNIKDIGWKVNAMWVTLPLRERKQLLHNYVKESK